MDNKAACQSGGRKIELSTKSVFCSLALLPILVRQNGLRWNRERERERGRLASNCPPLGICGRSQSYATFVFPCAIKPSTKVSISELNNYMITDQTHVESDNNVLSDYVVRYFSSSSQDNDLIFEYLYMYAMTMVLQNNLTHRVPETAFQSGLLILSD